MARDMKFFLLYLFFFSQSLFAANSCRSLFQPEPQGYLKSDSKSQDVLHFVSTDPSENKLQHKIVGTVEFEYFEHSDKLMIHWIEVHPLVRGKGVSKKLVQALLQDFSATKEVVAYLTDSNFKIFKESYLRSNSLNQSVQQTPFYKVFAELGFSIVTYVDNAGDKVILTIKKGAQQGTPNS